MGRIVIDTDALHELAGQLANDARELGGLNLDLVRGWSHALPPPASLVVLGSESARIQARIGVETGAIALDAANLGTYADAVAAQERGLRPFGDLTRWGGRISTTAPSLWRRFRAWGGDAVDTVESAVLTGFRALVARSSTARGIGRAFALVTGAEVIGLAELAWTSIVREPATQVNEYKTSVASPKDLVAIAGQLAPDEIAIVEVAPNHYVVMVRGVRPDVGSRYNSVAVAGVEEITHGGPYSDAVLRAIKQYVPENSIVDLLGHSEGGIVAVNVSDRLAANGYIEGSVLTLGAPVTAEVSRHSNLIAVVNDPYGLPFDPVVKMDHDVEIPAVFGDGTSGKVVTIHQGDRRSFFPHGIGNYENATELGPHSQDSTMREYWRNMHVDESQRADVRVVHLGA